MRSMVKGENPRQMSLPFALWNRLVVMQLIMKLFDMDMPICTACEYLLRWANTELPTCHRCVLLYET